MWVGKCIFCDTKIVVELNGETDATVEHILALNHGGDNSIENLALACYDCNSEKGSHHDKFRRPRGDLVERLQAKRQQRWRDS